MCVCVYVTTISIFPDLMMGLIRHLSIYHNALSISNMDTVSCSRKRRKGLLMGLELTTESDLLIRRAIQFATPSSPYPAIDILICKTQLINCISDLYHTSTAYSHVHNRSTKHTDCVTQQSINQTYRLCNSTIDQPNIHNV